MNNLPWSRYLRSLQSADKLLNVLTEALGKSGCRVCWRFTAITCRALSSFQTA